MTRPLRGRAAAALSMGLTTLAALVAAAAPAAAQDDDSSPGSYEYQRKVRAPSGGAGSGPKVVVTEFFTQGALEKDGSNLLVEDARHRPVPWRVLQVGPGDACRLAFQPSGGVHEYRVAYGGKPAGTPPKSPPWGEHVAGLLLETRRWRNVDLNQYESLRAAFDAAEPLAADYVPSVYHRYNPVAIQPEPYLSRHTGTLMVDRAGRHTFYTSSQDASFVRIDGKAVVAWPGFHGPVGDTRFKGEISLTSGPHAFEYLHGASGLDSTMVAAWLPPGGDKPEMIPPAHFGSNLVARAPTTELLHRGKKVGREFTFEVDGEAPLADIDQPLVRVRFHSISYAGLAARPRTHWDFGDGQTSNAADPVHVYLKPGLYTVKLGSGPGNGGAGATEGGSTGVVNRVWVGRAVEFDDKNHPPDQLAAYLPLLEKYDPAKLDLGSLLQYVRALEQAGPPAVAAKAGQAGLLTGREKVDDLNGLLVAREVGSLFRDRLDDPSAALALWEGAAKVLARDAWKAECEVQAADILLNDLLRPADARAPLDAATGRRGAIDTATVASHLDRVRGDGFARQGKRDEAIAAYAAATAALGDRRTVAAQEAWRGALSRSTEAFLRDRQLDRAREELKRWQAEFPADKVQGYLSLLMARLQSARGKPDLAVAVAGDLLAVSPDSPYADRVLFLAADTEERRNRPDAARARFQSLLTDYPGSPLVSEAKARVAKLDARPKAAAPAAAVAPPAAAAPK